MCVSVFSKVARDTDQGVETCVRVSRESHRSGTDGDRRRAVDHTGTGVSMGGRTHTSPLFWGVRTKQSNTCVQVFFHENAWICAPRTTDRDLESQPHEQLNAWMCARQTVPTVIMSLADKKKNKIEKKEEKRIMQTCDPLYFFRALCFFFGLLSPVSCFLIFLLSGRVSCRAFLQSRTKRLHARVYDTVHALVERCAVLRSCSTHDPPVFCEFQDMECAAASVRVFLFCVCAQALFAWAAFRPAVTPPWSMCVLGSFAVVVPSLCSHHPRPSARPLRKRTDTRRDCAWCQSRTASLHTTVFLESTGS